MKRLSLIALAAVGVTGAAQAQTATTITTQSGTQMQPMQQGAPMVQSGTQVQVNQGRPQTMNPPAQAMAPSDSQQSFKDEYGNRYNSRGDRIDARGRVIAPPVTPPGARALR